MKMKTKGSIPRAGIVIAEPRPTIMKTILQLRLTRAFQFRGTFLIALAVCFAGSLAATDAAPPSVQPLLQGKWAGDANSVKVMGNYAYSDLWKQPWRAPLFELRYR